ncbi:SPOR domain-containing protein [Rhodoferax sp. OV413]|uniref:SPOR domain-containing protein n=1 Tax=Rhodoferax sp. OV413 TaxID=1855285 RepID=UPI0025D0B92E|nr:SPOR domain-containing protein [Rhodoferax sp. OV413]
MAIFKFRKGGDEQPAQPAAPESVEAMRKRARHRLIGATVLIMLGVVGFPMLFDSQPRPIAVDILIEIPDRGKVRPLGAPALPAATQSAGSVIEEREAPAASRAPGAPATTGSAAPAAPAAAAAAAPQVALAETTLSAVKPEAKSDPKPEPKPEPKLAAKTIEKAEVKPSDKPTDKVSDAAKAQALLEGKTPAEPQAAETGRFVVQVGAYNESPKAQETRMKVEKAGFKTYTQVVGPKDNQRIRVRVGPFTTKAEALKVAEKIKALSLPASIFEL